MLRAVTRRSLSQPLPSARAQGFATFSPRWASYVANCEQRLSLVSSSLTAHYEKLRSFQLRARLRDAAEGPRSTMAAPRGYWLTAKGHCPSRQLVATRKGAPMGILRTHNKPQLLRPHRQVFPPPPTRLPGPSVVGPQACASRTYCQRTRMHGKAARPGKTIGFLSRENHYFPGRKAYPFCQTVSLPSHLERASKRSVNPAGETPRSPKLFIHCKSL